MHILERGNIESNALPGRIIQKAVGKDSCVASKKMTMGFARYSRDAGIMEPHNHAEEILYVLDTKGCKVRIGTGRENLGEPKELRNGMVIHFEELEWHVFEMEEKGYLDVLFFYGQVDNIRPEEMEDL